MSTSKADHCTYCSVRRDGLCSRIDEQDAGAMFLLRSSPASVRVMAAEQVVYDQGDPAHYAYTLISGWVALHRDLPDGRRLITRFLLPNAVFGMEPAGATLSHGATVIADAVICAIPMARFNELRAAAPAFNEGFVEYLSTEHHVSFDAMAILGQGSALERVARLCWELVVQVGKSEHPARGAVVKAPLSQPLIAQATGLTAIHVNRMLRALREEKVVTVRDGAITVDDPARLRSIAKVGEDSPRLGEPPTPGDLSAERDHPGPNALEQPAAVAKRAFGTTRSQSA